MLLLIRMDAGFASSAQMEIGSPSACARIRLGPSEGDQSPPLPLANSILVSDIFFDAIHDAPGMQASGISIPALLFLQHSHPALHEWGSASAVAACLTGSEERERRPTVERT